jgi:ParB family chromosome partitioning protein
MPEPDRSRRLGRGLGALISASAHPSAAPAPEAGAEPRASTEPLRDIRLDLIQPNPLQPRRTFADGELVDLVSSLRTNGLLQPITVRAHGDGHYEIIAGERRFRAARQLGWVTMPAFVRDASNEQMLSLALVENLQRSDLNPIEEAQGYSQLVSEFGLAHQQIADAVGKDRSTVTNALRLLSLPSDVLQMVRDGALTVGHARALLALPDEDVILDTARRILAHKLTVRDVERLAQESSPSTRKARARTEAAPAPLSPEVKRLADRLRRHLQTDVTIQADPRARGELRIRFYSADDLDRLLDLILGPSRDGD